MKLVNDRSDSLSYPVGERLEIRGWSVAGDHMNIDIEGVIHAVYRYAMDGLARPVRGYLGDHARTKVSHARDRTDRGCGRPCDSEIANFRLLLVHHDYLMISPP